MADDSGPMRRVSVPAADAEIGIRHPVLSHGFVALVDYMGDDSAIVQAARVSYGRGTKSVRDDRGLIRYLMRHRHTTPFEMVEAKFLVRLPIFVARQWIRHRTACLTGETKLVFDLPSGPRKGRRRAYPIRLDALWKRYQPTVNRDARHQRNPHFRRERLQAMLLRQLDEDTLAFRHTHVRSISESGVKPVFRMTLEDGKSIECTADHRFLFDDGWATLKERIGLHEASGRAVWTRGTWRIQVNGAEVALPALYHDKKWLVQEYVERKRPISDLAEACGVVRETVEFWVRRHGIPSQSQGGSRFVPGNSYASLRKGTRGKGTRRMVPGNGREPYSSREWLRNKWVREGLSASTIAAECGASPSTIRRWLRKYGLTNHPDHPVWKPFPKGHSPWNQGRSYRLGPRPMTPTRLATVRAARSGPASNFWKGGVATDREGIGRWTSQIAPRVHARHHWTCQLCYRRAANLHAHHVIPVWADLSRARDESNLTTLCDDCHREVHRDERSYVELLSGSPVTTEWTRRPRIAWNRLTTARPVTIKRLEYLGERMTYDVEVDGPYHNFVANGIVTHNSVNEYSARYSVVPDEFELPDPEEIRHQSGRNRQGRGEPLPKEVVEEFRANLERISKDAYDAYSRALEDGVARETARLLLPVAYYTQWYWKSNLWNLFHFLSLRLDPHAQEEIRLYAAELAQIVRRIAPVAYEAFEEFTLSGLSLSRREQSAVKGLLAGLTPEAACESAGLPLLREDGKRMVSGEGIEFLEKLERMRASD